MDTFSELVGVFRGSSEDEKRVLTAHGALIKRVWLAAKRAEREACAQCAENYDLGTPEGHGIAAVIRSRK